MSSAAPRVLLVTSDRSSSSAVTPVLAALEVAGLSVRAIDVGRMGSDSEGAVERVMRAITGEFGERKLSRELEANPPDVAIAFDPGTTAALSSARDDSLRPAPVVAVVPELSPKASWASTDADRYLAVDDESAVTLSDHGVAGDRVITVGPLVEAEFALVGAESRAELRQRFKLGAGPAVLVEVDGLGYETTSQLALQLSLNTSDAVYLFAAGNDKEAAQALRRQVPVLEMKAKLFGHTSDAPLLWRCADVVVARPRPATIARVLAVGARLVAFLPDDGAWEDLAIALEERGLCAIAKNSLLVSSALEPMLAANTKSAHIGSDGAATVADITWVVGNERVQIIERSRAEERAGTSARVNAATQAAQASAKVVAAAGELEDLSGGFDISSPQAPDLAEIASLRGEVEANIVQVTRTIADAQNSADRWEKKQASALRKGIELMARQAERNADLERARMHAALQEMAQLQAEKQRLDEAEKVAGSAPPPRKAKRAPKGARGGGTSTTRSRSSIDDLLSEMKREAGSGKKKSGSKKKSGKKKAYKKKAGKKKNVDDDLAALKRKMKKSKRK